MIERLEKLITLDKDPNEMYEILSQIGEGSYGKVYWARHK